MDTEARLKCDMGKRRALLIAVDDYDDPDLTKLRSPVRDVEAMSTVLADPEIGNYDVHVMHNARSHVLAEAIEEFFADADRDDLLLLQLSCHGLKDAAGDLYFAGTNTRIARPLSTGLSAALVARLMGDSRSRRCVLILDCCFSGAFERGMRPRSSTTIDLPNRLGTALANRGKAVLTASSALEYAFEAGERVEDDASPSLFTTALARGLRTGEADTDGDGFVSIEDLHRYSVIQVRAVTSAQSPQLWTYGLDGRLDLARRKNPWRSQGVRPNAVSLPLARFCRDVASYRRRQRLTEDAIAECMKTTTAAVVALEEALAIPSEADVAKYLECVGRGDQIGHRLESLRTLVAEESGRQRLWRDMPQLTEPIAAQWLNEQLAYKSRASAEAQATKWRAILAEHPIYDPRISGFSVIVSDQRDPVTKRWPLVWQPHSELVWNLTPTEKELLRLLTVGLTTPEIADQMLRSIASIRNITHSLFSKLGVASREEAIRLYAHGA